MALIKKIDKAYNILSSYSGDNPYILILKRDVYVTKTINTLSDFQVDFIIDNENFSTKIINKIIKIADWYGERLQKKYELSFTPNKINIVSYLGKTDSTYVCFAQYKQKMEPSMLFIPINGVLTDFLCEDYNNIVIDFERYNRLSEAKQVGHRIKPQQETGIKFLVSRKHCILADDMGFGKMEPIDSLIPTTQGFKKMGEIKVGDKVFNRYGLPTTVLQTFYHTNKDIYKVTFSDHTSCECGLEHLWVVRDRNMRKRKQGWKTMSLQDILKMGVHYSNGNNKFEIPVCEPVQYEEKKYLIEPYLLGICIGDGNLCCGGIHISIPDYEIETYERIKSMISEEYEITVNRSSSCPRYRIVKGKANNKPNMYLNEVRRLGLDVKGDDKFIPEEYKLGSIEQRIELLRGLMDSDGTISKRNNKISFATTSKRLAEDVMELVNSLGGTSRLYVCDRRAKGKNIEYYVGIQIKINPFHLAHKKERYNPTFKKYCTKYISNVEYSRKSDAQCLMVDSECHTYLTGKPYIVTHNTKSSIVAAIEGNYDSILIICPASLKTNWKDELMWYIPEKDITIIDGFNDKTKGELEVFLGYKEGKSGLNKAQLLEEAKNNGKWQHNRFVIVNYDILDEFYKIKSARSNPNIEQSPMYEYIKNRKSLIIIDEAHKLSNSTSNTYKLIKSLIRKGKPEGLFLLTGTPVTNDPQNLFSLLALLDSPVCNDWDFYMKRYCGAIDICKEKDKRDIITKEYLARHGKRTWYELNDDEKKELDREVKQKCKHITIAKDPQNLDELKERISHIYLRRVKEDLGILPQKYVKQRLYTLTKEQSDEYERLWEEYETAKLNEDPTKELNKELLEGGIYRRYISNLMIPYTEQFVDKILAHDEKCIIACCFDEELYTLKEYYGNKCVIYNGKMSIKQKDAAKDAFMNDPNIKVFIGNIDSAGVGLTLTAARFVVFNDFSYGDYLNKQMEDRVYRIGQTKDCYIYYQMFKGTEYERMYNITQRKNNISETLIKKESDK